MNRSRKKDPIRSIGQLWMNLKIQRKMITLIIIFILMPVAGVSAYSFLVQRPRLVDDARIDIEGIAGEVSNRFQLKVNDSIEVLQILAKSTEIENYLDASPPDRTSFRPSVEKLFTNIALHTFGIAQVRYLNSSGYEVVRVDIAQSFVYYGNDNPEELTIVEGDALQDKGSRGYFTDTKSLAEGEVYISDLDLNREQGKIQIVDGKVVPVLRYATPLYQGSNFEGIIILNYYFQSVFDDVVKAFGNVFSQQQITVLQDTGEYLFNTGELEWTAEVNSRAGDTSFETIFDTVELPESLFKEEGGTVETGGNIYASNKIDIAFSDPTFKIYSLITVPISSILGQINLQIAIAILITLIVALVSIIIAYFSIKTAITDPIHEIVLDAEKIAAGDLRVTEDRMFEREDEIGVLSHQFTTMQSNLNSFVKNIKSSTLTFTEFMEQLFLASQEVRNITRDTSSSFNQIAEGIDKQAAQNTQVSTLINDYTDLVLNVVTQMEETVELIKEINEEVTFIALNAQIEAARVGAVGRGFMIVASSIRDLAKNTKDQLKSMQNNMKLIKEKVDSSVNEINTTVGEFTSAAQEVVSISKSSEDQLNTQFAIFMEMANTITTLNSMAKGLLDSTKVFNISE